MEEIDKIIQAIQNMDNDTLKNTLAYLIKVYIIDKKVLYDGTVTGLAPVAETSAPPLTFTALITEIKRNYKMEELKKFSIEGGKVYITLDNKRYQLSSDDDNNSAPKQSMQERGTGKQEYKREPGAGGSRFRNIEMDE